jgi:uncharacterized membrane protein
MAEGTIDRQSLTGAQPGAAVATQRLWEIDMLRGITVIAMIYFHLMWDLSFYGLTDAAIYSLPWQIFARGIGSTFTFLLGISLVLTAARLPGPAFGRWVLKRGAVLLGLGMIVTVATFVMFPDSYVRFGILHLLGSALWIAAAVVRAPAWVSLVGGLAMLAGGFSLNAQVTDIAWLVWLGLAPPGMAMVDYYPILPWAGWALLGVALGRTLYPGGQRRFSLPDFSAPPPIRGLRWLGRNSLIIYLAHQPILIGIVAAIAWLRAG